MRNLGAQQATRQDCTIFGGKAGCPPEMRNFLEEVAQPAAGPSPREQPVRGMDQTVIDRLPLCEENSDA